METIIVLESEFNNVFFQYTELRVTDAYFNDYRTQNLDQKL